MRKLIFCMLLQAAAMSLLAAENDYAVSKIDPSLLTGASAVKRYEYVRFEIKDAGTAVYYYKTATTILNENGDEHAQWVQPYDKFNSVRSVNAVLYDATGKKVRELKSADISDLSGTSEISLAEDTRIKMHNFHYKVYPYTVEYEVEIKKHQLLFMPRWMPIEDESFSVEKSVFEVVCPSDYTIRYRAFNYEKQPVISGDKEKTYHWQVSNLAAIKDEFASPEFQKITPTVLVGPTAFEISGYKGDMSDWKGFGKFVYMLKQNRDNLPDNVKAEVHRLTDNVTDVRSKIEVLYNYMQQNTRYVSIQLGIGSWQPFAADYVAQKKYGDCKALSNYMFALLKEAGIRSVYTLVRAGETRRSLLEDFPAQQFNHVILSVPLQKDTVWLECTSQTLPAGYLSGFTSNRYALMIDEDGGHLVRTPRYNLENNLLARKISATVDETGKLQADIATKYTGIEQDDIFGMINSLTKKEQLEALKKEFDVPTYDITAFDYSTTKASIPAIDEKLTLVADNYAQVSGKRLFLQPNLLSKSSVKLSDEGRKYDVELLFEYRYKDTVEITIPAGFTPESLPQAVSFSNKFCKYQIDFKVEGTKVIMRRLFERKSGTYPAADYKELVKSYTDIYKADRGKVVLVKKEG